MPRILLVEDIKLHRDVMSRWLSRWSYEVTLAVDGEEAISKTHSDKPDLILMDLGLPKTDGWEAARRLKTDAATCQIPIIALTSHVQEDDRAKALSAGCDKFFTKPPDFKRLQEMIEVLLRRTSLPE